ncbi:MAG TPA: PQQ-binding-like beta-propeller repeat protein, partial [Labilithrix sp.]
TATATPIAIATDAGKPFARASWGSQLGQLGHSRLTEGNAEGPMSLAASGNEIVVLDQQNGRLVRWDKDGRPHAAGDARPTVQDIAVAKDGTVAMLDRLSAKAITLVDERGRTIGEVALSESRTGETGLLTGVFVDGNTVYVEKGHGALVPVATLDGKPADEGAQQLQGRPSRDGTLLLSARISSGAAGQIALNAFDRKKGALRFARVYQMIAEASAILLLDTDARGVVYLAASSGEEAMIACIDPQGGQAIGRVEVAIGATPDESFRDMAVLDDGTIVYAYATEDGIEYRTARCP